MKSSVNSSFYLRPIPSTRPTGTCTPQRGEINQGRTQKGKARERGFRAKSQSFGIPKRPRKSAKKKANRVPNGKK